MKNKFGRSDKEQEQKSVQQCSQEIKIVKSCENQQRPKRKLIKRNFPKQGFIDSSKNKKKSTSKSFKKFKRLKKMKSVEKIANISYSKESEEFVQDGEAADDHFTRSKKITASRGKSMNSCKKRKNPYFIHQQNKKDEFYKKLNEQYIEQLEKHKSKTLQKSKSSCNMKGEMENNQDGKLRMHKSLNQKIGKEKQVIFRQKINIREYDQQDDVVNFRQISSILEDVNEQENKLDC